MKREIEQITITLEVELYDKLKKNANKNKCLCVASYLRKLILTDILTK